MVLSRVHGDLGEEFLLVLGTSDPGAAAHHVVAIELLHRPSRLD
jgi:hypothetical protein